MIFWLFSCTTSTEPAEVGKKNLTIFRAENDDLIETVFSALDFHNMRPDTVLYHPNQKELIEEFPKGTQFTLISTSRPTLSSLPKHSKSILILTTDESTEIQKTSLRKDSYISWESETTDWIQFFSSAKEKITPLTPKQTFALTDVPEPSGLAIHPKTKSLWTVSDETGMVIDLGIDAQKPTSPHAHNAFQITDFEENDLEGIAFIDNKLCVVVESQRKLLCYDDKFQKVSDQKIEGPYSPEKDNKGPEGLSKDGIIINEGFPTAVANTGRIVSIGTDISGIAKDGENYWFLSQTDGTISLVNSKYQTKKIYGFPDDGLEGIVVFENSIFVVSDANETLYHLNKPEYNSEK